jgi:branched-chain amino acid transport system substrate-binding protein
MHIRLQEETMQTNWKRRGPAKPASALTFLLIWLALSLNASAAEPIRIGFSVALTGGVAANGKQVLLAMKIWRDDVNANGGLLGRQIQFVYYDDQSNPSNVPALYTKLIEADKVDLTIGPYGTNMVAPAIVVLKQHNYLTLGLFAVAANRGFHYDRYFSMLPAGPHPRTAFSEGFFELALQESPKPVTVAISGADAEFARASTDGARINAQKAGLKIVYDKSYPPNTMDFGPIIRAIQATNPDIVYNASYPPDTLGMIRAAHENELKTKMFGGNMIGLLATVFKRQLGPLLNGVISTADTFLPSPSLAFPGVNEVLAKYQARAPKEGVDPLGFNYAPLSYAAMQVLQQAVQGSKSLDQGKLAVYMHSHTFNTVSGPIAFGADGEWTKPRIIVSQFQHVDGNDIGQFKDARKQVIVWPQEYKSGNLEYPYTAAEQ